MIEGRPGSCDLEEVAGIVEVILREDLEGLARGYSFDERLEFWNEIKESYSTYIRYCARRLDREVDRLLRGKFRLAQLMIAASFLVNKENMPEITGRFRDEEYRILFDLEELKEIDYLSIDEIVELIERREGKVYEIVKKYYERGYHMLDTKWTKLMGPLALAMAEKYRERRRKIEDAVVEYIRRRPLTVFMAELEEAIIKAYEAGEVRREASRVVERARVEAERVEPLVSGREDSVEAREKAIELVEKLIEQLEEARRRLLEKEAELEGLARKYGEASKAREVLEAELEALRARVRELEEALSEYKQAVTLLRAERDAIAERLRELEAGLEGAGGGNLVTRDETWALEDAFVERIVRKLADGATIYDPVRGESRSVKWSKKIYYSLHGDGRPAGRGVQLLLLRGVLRRRKDIVVDAVTLVHRDAYDEKGWDSRPAMLGEVMELVESRLLEAGREDYYHILAISSPTGFSEKARSLVESDTLAATLASRHVTVYLVDPVKGVVYYNKRDPAAEANLPLVEPRLPEEKVRRVLEYLRSREAMEKAVLNGPNRPFLLVSQIVEATGEDLEVVLRALSEAEEQGLGRVLVEAGNAKAFFYSRR